MIVKIQNRRGQYVDFDPSKLLPGEFAIVQTGDPNTADGKAIYIGVTAGNVKQIATLDELQSEVETALQSAIPEVVEEATQDAQDAADRAEAAAQTLEIDTTLTETGQAAEAKATGDAIGELNERLSDVKSDLMQTEDEIIEIAGVIEELECGLTEEVKAALLACFTRVAWISDDGQTYYDALSNALNYSRVLSRISAVFTQGSAVLYDTDELYALKQYVTVTATYDDGTTKEVNTYTLSGELVAGISTITVAYNKKTTTFNVTVTHQAKTLESISSTFSSSAVITTDNVLDDLRPYLTVRATYSDGSTNTITNYTLSGSLNVGTNTITVTYSGKTATFTVNVTQAEKTLQSISAVFNQGSAVIYTDTPLNDLKQYLTVTGHYSDETSQTITNYTLSGTLTEGTSTITVSYNGKTTTFNVTVSSHATYLTMNDIDSVIGYSNPTVTNGSVSCDYEGTKTFAVFAIKQSAMPIKFEPHIIRTAFDIPEKIYKFIIFRKDGNDYYGSDGTSVFKFTYDSTNQLYNATAATGITAQNFTGTVSGECTASIDGNNVLTVRTMDGSGSATFTNANAFGYWGSEKQVLLVNDCEVNYSGSV